MPFAFLSNFCFEYSLKFNSTTVLNEKLPLYAVVVMKNIIFDRSLNMEQEAREREREKERTQSLTGLPAATTGPGGDNSMLFLYRR
jgi:hypothetical protein